MDYSIVLLLLLLINCLFVKPVSVTGRSLRSSSQSRITVVGAVYCDTCSINAFTKHSYFLPGVDVQIRCKFKANSEKSTEQVNYSVNRTTDRHGVYKLQVPSIDGVNCADGLAMVSMCQARLVGTSSKSCSVPSLRSTSQEISIKSERDNLCIYSLNSLSYKPSRQNSSLCANKTRETENALDSSKCFFPWPNFPPIFNFPWPNLPFPFQNLPPITGLFSPPPPPPPPAFNFWDPRTWIPHSPPPPHDLSHNPSP